MDDWVGLDALLSVPLICPDGGRFSVEVAPVVPPRDADVPMPPFSSLLGDWARASDEYPALVQHLGSPSRLFTGILRPFQDPQGLSVRAAAEVLGRSVFDTARLVLEAWQAGTLRPTGGYAWQRLPHAWPDLSLDLPDAATRRALLARLDALPPLELGTRGWLRRDLLWELAWPDAPYPDAPWTADLFELQDS
ncbi:hypothetical protein [Deinococcus sonorensis]|uniref:Uncharacterized protein n=1 Tax=Deinococcus sonorensis TaxID=309891 RepID=A0ABV8YE98_9DEIO